MRSRRWNVARIRAVVDGERADGSCRSAELPNPKEVRDEKRDRFSVMASLTWKEGKKGRSATVRDGNGPGNTPNTINLRIREGTKVHLKLCYMDNGVVFKCSKPQAATA